MVRMHLLQAVVAFHSGQVARAKLLLRSTAQELDSLRVPEGSLKEVIVSLELRIPINRYRSFFRLKIASQNTLGQK